ncbi:MAG: UvrABC system protein C [Chlamydiae bacterium]|nr:UvrABC system protein C [Chlamydiota bacterium]
MKFNKTLYSKKPGVYLMKTESDNVLYVGKAKNLQVRLSQYFIPGHDSRPQIPLLIAKVYCIETIVVSSEKEALLLEHTLIKKHRPKYNFLLKDDKSYICLEITKHKWPLLRLVRSKDVKQKSDVFGPYTSGYAARKMLYLLQRLFPLRECSDFVLQNRTRPCILFQMNRCSAPCVEKCTPEDYGSYVDQVRQFLKGQNKSIIRNLKQKMKEASEQMEYEKAGHYLEMIKHIESLLEKQNVISQTSQNYDVLGLYREEQAATLSLLTFQKGYLVESKTFPMLNEIEEDPELISSFITQNYLGAASLPHEILVPWLPSSATTLSSMLSQSSAHKVKILVPQKGKKRDLAQMAYDNAKNAFSEEYRKQKSKEQLLLDLKEKCSLSNYPEVIECFDNSHLSGSNPVSVMVTFQNGCYDKSKLRKYHLSQKQVFDDLKGMEEVLLRRYRNTDLLLPDLIILDGGKNQLAVAQRVLSQLNIINIDIIALTKEAGRHDFGSTQERLFLPENPDPIILSRRSNLLFFLQNIRDQAHKSAILFQRKSRSKQTIKSVLDEIPGIGPKKKKALIERFKSPQKILEASLEQLREVKILNSSDLENLQKFLSKKK